jgi:hypothetical protein
MCKIISQIFLTLLSIYKLKFIPFRLKYELYLHKIPSKFQPLSTADYMAICLLLL